MTLRSCGSLWGLWGREINRVYSSTGTGNGTLILAPLVRSLTSTSCPDSSSGQLLHAYTKREAELRLSTVGTHTLLLLCLLCVKVAVSVYLWDYLKLSGGKKGIKVKRTGLLETVWYGVRGVMRKRPSIAEREIHCQSPVLLRPRSDAMNPGHRGERKKNKAEN